MVDFLTVGEPLVVFASNDIDHNLADSNNFQKYLAGAELNVAIGVSRLGFSTEYISCIGTDPLGMFIQHQLKKEKIGTTYLFESNSAWTGFEMKERVSHGDPGTFYFRKHSAVTQMTPDAIKQLDFKNIRFLHLTGIYPAISDNALLVTELLLKKAAENHTKIIFDPNLRTTLWSSKDKMIRIINYLASKADIVIPGIAEGTILTGLTRPDEIANFYLHNGCQSVVIKIGAKGAYLKDRDSSAFIPGFKTNNVIDTVGAGDGFAAGLISGLLDNCSLKDAVLRGNAVGALAVQTAGDSEGYPNKSELALFLKNKLPD